ncbi:hypothetical protein SSYRP_v1c00490 [Spiroplasma syrphidicola EA-1]|uniref:Uncharacterized protein n=1 Tax=Spiroplasma syrphidicola EA-1 TaxID=1276229 RepID=R4UHQ2_9MOLU|nr:hypothetical protein [Spiroplasma syrphidicola]AGM25645.1 hypothetical protein SSYRP_v1c00490 [Spiroplasma syrphidicola EA-1]
MKYGIRNEYYWKLFELNENKIQIINSLIKVKTNLLLGLKKEYEGVLFFRQTYYNLKKIFPDFDIVWIKDQDFNEDGLYNYFDIILYNEKENIHLVVSLLLEPNLIYYPIETIDYLNIDKKFEDISFAYIGCYIFNTQTIFEIIDIHNIMKHYYSDIYDNIVNILEKNWLDLGTSSLNLVKILNNKINIIDNKISNNEKVFLEKLISNNWLKEVIIAKEYLTTKHKVGKINRSLKNFVFRQIRRKSNKYDNDIKWYSLQELCDRAIYIYERVSSNLEKNSDLLFNELIETCQEFYDFNLYDYYFKTNNIENNDLLYSESELEESIIRLEDLYTNLYSYLGG